MFVTYKITCVITGMYYIGSHKTDNLDDGYMGSGRLIKESIAQYGVENHVKEILGVFDTREESLELEHKLIKEKRQLEKERCLNLSFGGSSFDYINQNLSFDWACFGKMASHQHMKNKRELNIQIYEKNPRTCLTCGKPIPYDLRHNKFCNSSCAATYNNKNRTGYKQKTIYCKCCGRAIQVSNCSQKQFCNSTCASRFREEHSNRQPSEKRLKVLADLDIIKQRHETESYRQIAEDYGVSGNFIKEAIKGRIK